MARPLNKIAEDGKPYSRPAEIEASIDEALTQDDDTLVRRARMRNRADREYMPLECLLHLVREARLGCDQRRFDRLFRPLLTRCEGLLKASIRDGGLADASGVREEILGAFCELLARVGTNHDATALDYFEVRFNHALASLRYKRLRKEQRRNQVFEDVAQMKDEDGKLLDDENTLARISQAAQSPAIQESFVHLGQMMEAINALPAPEREAVILVCIKGFKVESENPEEETAATLCKVSGRAIRKRLQNAAEKLKKFKQER